MVNSRIVSFSIEDNQHSLGEDTERRLFSDCPYVPEARAEHVRDLLYM